jgi:flagellar basal-body rod protein FlgC
MNLIDTLSVTASGLTAQRVRLQTVATNMANARTTRTEDGGPYRRRMPVFQAESDQFGTMLDQAISRVQVTEIAESDDPNVRVFDPGHPDADDNGYVEYPNVNVLEEMVDMMMTARTYEANTSVVQITRTMASQALELGR